MVIFFLYYFGENHLAWGHAVLNSPSQLSPGRAPWCCSDVRQKPGAHLSAVLEIKSWAGATGSSSVVNPAQASGRKAILERSLCGSQQTQLYACPGETAGGHGVNTCCMMSVSSALCCWCPGTCLAVIPRDSHWSWNTFVPVVPGEGTTKL